MSLSSGEIKEPKRCTELPIHNLSLSMMVFTLTYVLTIKMPFTISISSICKQFKVVPSLFENGENAFNSEHVRSFIFDGSLGILKGQVFASMKIKEYNV